MDQNLEHKHLKRVLFEFEFAPTLRVSRDVSIFQERFARGFDYQSASIKNPFTAGIKNAPGYHFENSKLGIEMELFEDSFSFAVTQYPGFEKLRAKVLQLVEGLADLFGIVESRRLGLRYTNTWNFLPEDEEYRIPEVFHPHLDFSHQDVGHSRRFYVDLETPLPGGGLNCRSTFRVESLDPTVPEYHGYTEVGIYTLDLDAFNSGPVPAAQTGFRLGHLHQTIKIAYTRHLRKA